MSIYSICNSKGMTLLVCAIHSSNSEAVNFILEKVWNKLLAEREGEADTLFEDYLNKPTPDALTSVHFAVMDNNLTLLKRLVNLGANLHSTTKNGLTVLHLAASNKDPSIVGLICFLSLKYPDLLTAKDSQGWIPLHYAAHSNAPVATHYLAAFMIRYSSTSSKLSSLRSLCLLELP